MDGTAEIIVQAANFVYNGDGAWPPVFTIGFSQNITQLTAKETVISFVIVGCLLLTFMTKSFFMMFFPDYNWFIGVRVEYIVLALVFAMLVLFLDVHSPGLFHKLVTRTYYSITGIFILIAIIFDPFISSDLIEYFKIVTMVIIIYVFVRMAIALKHGSLSNWLAFIGILVTGIFGLNDILYSRGTVLFGQFGGQFFFTPVGMMFFVFCFSLVLSICKEIIKAHDGTITIQSEINKGTAVFFTLPAAKEDGNGRTKNGLIG